MNNKKKNRLSLKLSLQTRVVLALSALVLIQTALLGGYALSHLASTVEEQIGLRALQMANAVAQMPAVIYGVKSRDSESLQTLVEAIRQTGDARFIVIGDTQGIRFTHPIPERIGKPRVGDDNEPALKEGKSYISKATGSLGPSIRGKAPIIDRYGQIIGVVSVGYMVDKVDYIIDNYQRNILFTMLIALAVSAYFAILISKYIKKLIFGLEPEEIARLFNERNATLESIREGVISVNADGIITTFNRAAIETLGLEPNQILNGKPLREVLPNTNLLEILESGKPQFDHESYANQKSIIVNRIPIIDEGKVTGVVSSFRRKDEMEEVSRQLTRIQHYAETLRSQAHEYSNKLHTIAGLIEIGATEQALEIIGQETQDHQALLHFLVDAVKDPVLSGCLLGKFNRAHEMGLKLTIDKESRIDVLPPHIAAEQLVTVLGNILDNAFEATLKNHGKEIQLSMTDLGNDLIFEVEDQGAGIPPEEVNQIFEKGVSSKSETGHGWGLYLARQIINQLHGQIEVECPSKGGSRITVYLPKRQHS